MPPDFSLLTPSSKMISPKMAKGLVHGRKPPAELLIKIADLNDHVVVNRTPIVTPWLLAGSITLLFSAPKIGKTWFSIFLAEALITGENFLSWEVPGSSPVLFVDGEMSLGELRDRIALTGVSGNNFNIISADSLFRQNERRLNLTDVDDQMWLNAAIVACGAEVVIFDNLSCLTADFDQNDNSSSALEVLIRWFIRLRYAGIAVVLVHHSGHDGRHPRGASRLVGLVDTVVRLSRETNQSQGTFQISFPQLRGEEPTPNKLSVALLKAPDETLSLVPVANAKDDRTRDILRLIRDDEVATQKDLAAALGLSTGRVSGLMSDMRGQGLIAKGNKLTLTAKGKKLVADGSEFSGSKKVHSAKLKLVNSGKKA